MMKETLISFLLLLVSSMSLNAQSTVIDFSFVLKCIRNEELVNAEYLTNKNFTCSKNDTYNMYLKGNEKDQISFEEYFLADRSYDYISIVFGENQVSNYNSLVASIKANSKKSDFFFNDWHDAYTYKYSANGINFYFYMLKVAEQEFYHIYVSTLELEKGLFKGWGSDEYEIYYRGKK